MHEFIDQKKEMFNAELAYNSVKEEIKDLDLKRDRREHALGLSQRELEKDKYELIKFVIEDNTQKKAKLDLEQVRIALRAAKDDEVKELDTLISRTKLEIIKSAEKLKTAIQFKKFLLSLDKEFAMS